MSAPHMEKFLEESLALPGNPSFNYFVSSIALKGILGQENASRIRYYGSDLISDETNELLSKIEESPDPEQHPLIRHVFPLVRTAEDFTIGDMVYVQPPETNATFSLNPVWGVEHSIDPEEITETGIPEDGPDRSRGLVLIEKPGFGLYKILPQWPALVPEPLVTAANFRKQLDKKERLLVTSIVSSYFQSCFFDRMFADSVVFNDRTYSTIRNLARTPYTRPKK